MFYEAFIIFVERPWLALVPAMVFCLLYYAFRFRLVVVTALLWAIYSFYELGIWSGLYCDEDCNIRVDLLVIYPLLTALSGWAILRIVWVGYRGNS